jgi:hypothetical protein
VLRFRLMVKRGLAFALNIPLASRLYRERGRRRELGLTPLSKSLWKVRRRGRWASQAFRWAPAIVLLFLPPFLAVVDIWNAGGLSDSAIFALLFSVFVVVLLFLSGYLRNQRERMEIGASAEELKKALQGLQQRAGKSETVSVPSELLELAAGIETAQIAKERTDAVLQSVSGGQSGYGVL